MVSVSWFENIWLSPQVQHTPLQLQTNRLSAPGLRTTISLQSSTQYQHYLSSPEHVRVDDSQDCEYCVQQRYSSTWDITHLWITHGCSNRTASWLQVQRVQRLLLIQFKPGLYSTSTIFFRRGIGTAVAPELLFVVQPSCTSVRTTPVFLLSNQSAGVRIQRYCPQLLNRGIYCRCTGEGWDQGTTTCTLFHCTSNTVR